MSIRWVNAEYEINENPVGLYSLPNTKANTLYTLISDILTRCSLHVGCRGGGASIDGALSMQGKQSGLATKIRGDVPSALPVHCLGHCLSLYLQDAG